MISGPFENLKADFNGTGQRLILAKIHSFNYASWFNTVFKLPFNKDDSLINPNSLSIVQ